MLADHHTTIRIEGDKYDNLSPPDAITKKARTPVADVRAFLSQPVLCETGCRVVGAYICICSNTLLDFIIVLQNRCFGCGLIKHPYRPFFILFLVGYIHRTTNKCVKHITDIDDGCHACHSV